MSLVRRLLSVVLALCLALFSVESALADVHDHGSSTWVTAVGVPDDPAGEGRHHEQPDDGHPLHVCHCAHGHAAGSVVPVQASTIPHPTLPFVPEWDSANRPSTRVQEPLVPPPIA